MISEYRREQERLGGWHPWWIVYGSIGGRWEIAATNGYDGFVTLETVDTEQEARERIADKNRRPCLVCTQAEAVTYCRICGRDMCRSCFIDHAHSEYAPRPEC